MNKTFVTFAVVIVSFAVGIVLLTWNEPTDGLDLLAVILFLFTGWYATKFKFGKLNGKLNGKLGTPEPKDPIE